MMLPYCEHFGVSDKAVLRLNTVIVFTTTVAMAVAMPTIGHVISLMGGVAALVILVFPGKM